MTRRTLREILMEEFGDSIEIKVIRENMRSISYSSNAFVDKVLIPLLSQYESEKEEELDKVVREHFIHIGDGIFDLRSGKLYAPDALYKAIGKVRGK